MIIFANAKINLGLYILSKRQDGYHNIASLKYPIPLFDVIEILPSTVFQLETVGAQIDGKLEDNLIWKAYHLLQHDYKMGPVRIILRKNIPMGAGIGGGSSDATHTLKGLNDFFGLNLSASSLRNYAAQLGSDCPFFVDNVPQIATGKGEILQPFDFSLKGKFIHLIHPNIHVSTADAYAQVEAKNTQFDWECLKNLDFTQWRSDLKNDFEPSVFAKYPEIAEWKAKLQAADALYTSMSGSGSSVFGLFDKQPKLFEETTCPQFIFELP